jgi:hypothetical protein
MKDPIIIEKTALLKEKINEVNLLLEDLHASEILVLTSQIKSESTGANMIQITHCKEHVDYLKD